MKYFNEALGDFINEAANGGVIRHLTDVGYTADEIRKHLTFQISDEKLDELIRKRKIENGTLDPPDGEKPPGYRIIKEQGKYGKISFRKIYDRT